MTCDSILVLGSNRNKVLAEKLFEFGLTAIVRESMQSALERLRTGHFAAIIVDRAQVECDVLEFVLNVRDFNDLVPVFVLGRSPGKEDDKLVLADRRTFVADAEPDFNELTKGIESLDAEKANADGRIAGG